LAPDYFINRNGQPHLGLQFFRIRKPKIRKHVP
jgi:hypothetical protein